MDARKMIALLAVLLAALLFLAGCTDNGVTWNSAELVVMEHHDDNKNLIEHSIFNKNTGNTISYLYIWDVKDGVTVCTNTTVIVVNGNGTVSGKVQSGYVPCE